MQKRGRFVVVDGLDGVGKGVILQTLIEEARKTGKRIFDVHTFWKDFNHHPSPIDIIGQFDIAVTSEPTFIGVGAYIRSELIAKNNRDYHPLAIAEAYALDRRILYQQLILPLLSAGVDVFQSRSFSTSITYQVLDAQERGVTLSMEDVLSIPGNGFCLQHPMNYLIVPTISDAEEVMRRLAARDKDDNCVFENAPFQFKLKERYESPEFQALFQRLGVNVVYLNAGISIESSQQQTREFYNHHLK